jgi:predicted nucleic acid-binding protein
MGTHEKTKVIKEMIFVDSNMWCYYFDQRLPEHEQVLEPMREIIKSEEIACNTIIVVEVAHYLVRHFAEGSTRKKIEYFVNLRNMKITDFNRQIMTETIETLLEHAYADGLGGRDATVIATMNSQNMKKIISHDDIFKRLASKLMIEVIDPVQKTQK